MNLDGYQERPPARMVRSRVLLPRGIVEMDLPEWDPTCEGVSLRGLRQTGGPVLIGLRECAQRLGVKTSVLSSLETGRATLSDIGWVDLFAALAKVVEARR